MTFGERLRKAREDKGLASKEVAKAIGVAPSTYSQYETGSREPDVLKIRKISDCLQVSGDYLLFGIKATETSDAFEVTDFEKIIIKAYRNHPDMHSAINKMLDINENTMTGEVLKPPSCEISDFDAAIDVTDITLQNTTNKV